MRSDRVLWGHHVDEYCDMFDLLTSDLNRRILEYGCGPSAINVELHNIAHPIISCDPFFDLSRTALEIKVNDFFEARVNELKTQHERYDYERYGGLDEFIAYRRDGINTFLNDYEQGKQEERYRPIRGEHLPFTEFSFDLALSSHYLFVDPDAQNIDFHLNIIQELCRVAKEVRIYPLDQDGKLSTLLGPVLLKLQQANYGVEVRQAKYAIQRSGHAMLRVRAQECRINL